ncbi:arrestin (macronuclear) [Tetrahymena thermophila SB210]|uniref:Arrestin n=1 Tax=Tetrahymena thermophila (strain SB210) TaxID=312017 RepID=Q23FQ6_TETTS|nr:arrestin [Tetrahymena thermophila SB210]EAR95554.1 arrestin [Tetrahymena thermophila SB210]|eukprot:XP_001015799.1 arrestin [Tetrahymena thermophila SB210]
MGQILPNDKRRQVKGGIQIQLNKLSFVSNEVIQGLLYINIEEPFQGRFLQINLQGYEDVHYTYTQGSDESERIIYAKAMNSFLNYSMPIYDFSQGTANQAFVIQPCQLLIPFQLVIAQQLPSSIQYFENEHNKCSLKYLLTAQILSTEPNVKPISGSQEIFIGQIRLIQNLPNFTNSKQSPTICCCFKSGEINYSMSLNSRCFIPNEIINIKINADLGQNGNKVKNFSIKIIGLLEMKACRRYRDQVVTQFEKSTTFKINSKQVSQEIQLQIPSNVLLSSQGQLIQMNYYLQIIPDVNSCCCVTNESPHEMLIYINPNSNELQPFKGLQQQLPYPIPQNWHPIQLQQAQFNPMQFNQIQQLHLQNVAYEQKLFDNYIAIEPAKRKVDYQQEMCNIQHQNINELQKNYQQPAFCCQSQIQFNVGSGQQQKIYPTQNQNQQNNQFLGQDSLLSQPVMKDQNKTYL